MASLKKHLFLIACFSLTFIPFGTVRGNQDNTTPTLSEPQQSETVLPDVSGGNLPHLDITTTEYNAGEVYEGEEVVHTFIFKNTGTQELVIKDVKAG